MITEISNQTKKALETLKTYDAKGENNPDWALISGNIFKLFSENKPIRLITFTCSTINAKYMFDKKNPENYISLNPEGNNLEEDLPILNKLCNDLKKQNIPFEIIILIGNTDPYYIYTQEGKLLNIKKKELFKRYNKRWEKYRKILKNWLNIKIPKVPFVLLSWFTVEKEWEKNVKTDFYTLFKQIYKKINRYFTKKELEWELEKLKNAFGEGKYFESMKAPSQSLLKDWVKRKFAEYAVQGLWIKQIWPEGILIQNEMPTDLRYKIYQPLINEVYNTRLPNIYPYGIDNLSFQ